MKEDLQNQISQNTNDMKNKNEEIKNCVLDVKTKMKKTSNLF